MTILPINDSSAVDLAIQEIHRRPIIVQFPTVFALLAAPTSRGATQLDMVKKRLPNKNYGTVIGSLDKFIAQAECDRLPDAFSNARQYADLVGTFIRLPFRNATFQSRAINNGTHQGLLLSGVYADLTTKIEASFAGYTPDKIWDYVNYGAPLGTSCNISGDPDGSIVTLDKALNFARARGIGLFLTATQVSDQRGSYPILGFEKQSVTIHRNGPNLDSFTAKIPTHLRNWL